MNIRTLNFPRLSSEDCNRDQIRKDYLKAQAKIAINNLNKNNFTAHYGESVSDTRKIILDLIPDNSIIGSGDSHSIFALHLEKSLIDKGCTVIPHTCAVNSNAFNNKTPGFHIMGDKEQTREILMNYLVANVFILGANAITLDGQIINIDGTGNRVAGSIYGSDRIIIVAGANKLVKDLNAGLDRIHDVAAQMNNIKYHNELACNKCGVCMDCRNKERNCNITSIIHRKPDDADFHVIIIPEELGF